jgi:hypothetical protein
VSLLTGLQRRDVDRLRNLPDAAPPRPNHLARLVALWADEPGYDGADLPRRGPAPSFEALALRIRRDVHPRSLADQLVEAGTVAELAEDRLRLLRRFHQPLAGSEAQLDYLARNVGDHLSAAVGNVTLPQPRFLERAVHYNGLSAASVEAVEAQWRADAEAALAAANRLAMAAQQREPGTHRLRAGVYFFEEDEG